MRKALPAATAAIAILAAASWVQPPAIAQKLTLGVVAGSSLTADFRGGSFTSSGIDDGVMRSTTITFSPASRRFLIGPKLELALPWRLSLEVNALHRPVRIESTQTFSPPIVLPNGTTFSSFGPFTDARALWTFPILAKYRLPAARPGVFLEAGPSLRPAASGSGVSHLGITAGAGVEIHLGGLTLSPMVRYTRWKRAGMSLVDQVEALVAVEHGATDAGWASAFGRRFSPGILIGLGLGDDLRLPRASPTSVAERSESNSPVFGMLLEFGVHENLFVEANGIYRPLHGYDGPRFAVLTWEFPVLAKYKFRPSQALRPFVELGPSFRTDGNFNGPTPSHYGLTAGSGVEARFGKIRISPMVRYTRWAKERSQQAPSGRSTFLNQVQVLAAVSF
jgi:hypothetical protein